MMTPNVLPSVIDGRYELGELLGTGGSGAVYSAHDRQTGSHVALKLLHQPLDAAQVRERFERELAAYERMHAEPGVVTVLDHGVLGQRGWLVMDRYDLTLAQRLASEGALPVVEALDIARRCAQALAALHAQGIVHRDVKPSNVLLGNDGRVVLGDLGVVAMSGEPTLTGMTPLSLQWVAPETIESGEYSDRSDLYSLGATMFTMLHGHPPFDLSAGSEDGSAIAIGPALRLIATGPRPQLSDAIPADVRALVDQLMSTTPEDRPPDAMTVIERVQRARSATRAMQPASGIASADPARRWLAPTLVITALVGALIAAVLAFGTPVPATNDVNQPAQLVTAAESAEATAIPATPTPPTLQAERTDTPAPTPIPTPEPEPTPLPEPAEAAQPAPVSEPVPIAATEDDCGGAVVWCEPLLLDDFDLVGDQSLASFEEVDTPYGPGFLITPGPGTDSGAFTAERSLMNVGGADIISVRFRMLVESLPSSKNSEWFQQIVTLGDERQRFWSVNLTNHSQGGVWLNSGYFAPPDSSGGTSAMDPFQPGEWQCIELVLDQRLDSIPVEVFSNELTVLALDDDAAREHGVGFMLRLGPNWIEDTENAPRITLADVVVGDAPIGCA